MTLFALRSGSVGNDMLAIAARLEGRNDPQISPAPFLSLVGGRDRHDRPVADLRRNYFLRMGVWAMKPTTPLASDYRLAIAAVSELLVALVWDAGSKIDDLSARENLKEAFLDARRKVKAILHD